MIKALLMDFNGVIIDDEGVQMRAYQEVLKDLGIDLTEADYYGSLGMDDRTFIKAAFERAGKKADEATVDSIRDAKSAKWKESVSAELPMFDGLPGFIEKMSHDFAIGIVSMATRSEIDLVLERSGLGGFISTIVSAEDVALCKPDPECYRLGFERIDAARTAAGHLPMTHSECLAIEDSPPGIVAARAVGLQALGVSNTVSEAELRAAGASSVAKDLRNWMPASVRRVFV